MTYEEAIQQLIKHNLCDRTGFSDEDDFKAVDLAIKALETVIKHEETFEWCHDCKEYDQENHCCHRWNKCVRETISDNREHWYNEGFEDGKIHACSEGALREAYEQGKEEGYKDAYIISEDEVPCIVCGKPTNRVEYNYEAHICSAKCEHIMNEKLTESENKGEEYEFDNLF